MSRKRKSESENLATVARKLPCFRNEPIVKHLDETERILSAELPDDLVTLVSEYLVMVGWRIYGISCGEVYSDQVYVSNFSRNGIFIIPSCHLKAYRWTMNLQFTLTDSF